MELQVGVKVLLKNEEGKYLLVRRSPMKYPDVGPNWDIVGGRINPGTSLIENLKREVFEEVGLTLVDIPTLVAGQDIMNTVSFPDRHVVRLTYVANCGGVPKIDEESLEYKWFTKEEIESMEQNDLDRFFKELINNKKINL